VGAVDIVGCDIIGGIGITIWIVCVTGFSMKGIVDLLSRGVDVLFRAVAFLEIVKSVIELFLVWGGFVCSDVGDLFKGEIILRFSLEDVSLGFSFSVS